MSARTFLDAGAPTIEGTCEPPSGDGGDCPIAFAPLPGYGTE